MSTHVHALNTATGPAVTLDGPAARLARGGGWWTLFLALTMLGAMTEALYSAAWSEGLELVRLAVLGGALLAFALSLTRWQGLFPAVYGILASLAWIATLFNRSLFSGFTHEEGIRQLVTRNVEWFVALANGTASADNLIFVTQIAFLGWWIGYLAVWSLVRHQRLLHAAVPAGAALLVNVYYSSRELTGFLVVFLAAVLLLAIRLELARNEVRWQLARVRYAPDITFDFLKAGLVFTVLVIALAWTLPNAAGQLTVERLLRPFEGPWQQLEDTWNRMYRSLNYSTTTAPVSTFGKATTLGGPVSLTDRPIFEAEIDERTYWRAALYDTYTGAGWLNTDAESMAVERNESLGEPPFSLTRELTVTVRPLEQGQLTVFAPPQLLRTSVPVNIDFRPIGDADDLRTLSLVRSRVSLDREGFYDVTSAVTDASPDRLRADSTSYPGWVTQRYLQLPPDLPPRIQDLAARITTAYDNPYDKAEAVEQVLRTFTYNQQIAAPPPGADGVDYFLFDIRQGYCDYYASAMVVMLRSVGVPARFVVGYTPGQATERTVWPDRDGPTIFRILERNAHAWPEVFFPSYGWVQFEPTASEPVLARPAPERPEPPEAGLTPDAGRGVMDREEPMPDDFALGDEGGPVEIGDRLETWLTRNWAWLLTIVALGLTAWGGWRLAGTRYLAFFRDREVLTKLFGLLGLWASRLTIPWQASQTPLERATGFGTRLPEASPVAESVARLFAAQRYGREEPGTEALASLATAWRALQPALWRRWLTGAVTTALATRATRPWRGQPPSDPGPGRSRGISQRQR